jgi:hypothetical protein
MSPTLAPDFAAEPASHRESLREGKLHRHIYNPDVLHRCASSPVAALKPKSDTSNPELAVRRLAEQTAAACPQGPVARAAMGSTRSW